MKKSLVAKSQNDISAHKKNQLLSFREIRSKFEEAKWNKLGELTVQDAMQTWLSGLNYNTRQNYASGFKKLMEFGMVDLTRTLQEFSFVNHEAVVDKIKMYGEWSEATKQARAAAYISFTGFLQRRTQGMINKAIAAKEGANKTFYKIRDKVSTRALNSSQSRRFLQAIEKINPRDALIAKLMLQGGKRKIEVLTLKTTQIDFENNQIFFEQSKTRGTVKKTVINYPEHVMQELADYLGKRQGTVFITRNGKPVVATQIDRNFVKAGEASGIPFRVTPHVLRVTLVTRLKELSIQDTDIMKITGHANPAQLSSYDKSDLGNNASLYHHFV